MRNCDVICNTAIIINSNYCNSDQDISHWLFGITCACVRVRAHTHKYGYGDE